MQPSSTSSSLGRLYVRRCRKLLLSLKLTNTRRGEHRQSTGEHAHTGMLGTLWGLEEITRQVGSVVYTTYVRAPIFVTVICFKSDTWVLLYISRWYLCFINFVQDSCCVKGLIKHVLLLSCFVFPPPPLPPSFLPLSWCKPDSSCKYDAGHLSL